MLTLLVLLCVGSCLPFNIAADKINSNGEASAGASNQYTNETHLESENPLYNIDNILHETEQSNNLPECKFTVRSNSVNYFRSRLDSLHPNFVLFNILWDTNLVESSSVLGVFKPNRWVWTYSNSKHTFPYTSWNIDYGILSFGLLEEKTIEVPYMYLNVSGPCRMTLGTNTTAYNIASALGEVIDATKENKEKYAENYFCYMAEAEGVRNEAAYWAAVYLNYPVGFLNYNCYLTFYSYSYNKRITRQMKPEVKWSLCIYLPYVLGMLFFLFPFPIIFLRMGNVVAKDEHVVPDEEYDFLPEFNIDPLESEDSSDWIFQDTKSPLSFWYAFKSCWCKGRHCPVFSSRLRRFVSVLLAPSILYIEVYMYSKGMGVGNSTVSVVELEDAGAPTGLLSLLGGGNAKVFVPALGGPFAILAIYHSIGLLFFVSPRSVKQVVENGMPTSRSFSALFFGIGEIMFLSGLNVKPSPGYDKGAALCKCGFYMLFTRQFWFKVFDIQKRRLTFVNSWEHNSIAVFVVKYVCIVMLCCLGVVETIVTVIYYGTPFLSFVTILSKGASKSLINLRLHYRIIGRLFYYPCAVFIATVVILALYILYAYACCLIFVESFSFVCKICMFCFLAVIVYPAESFGYFFLFVAILYYFVHMIQCFGDDYLELLTLAVEISAKHKVIVNTVDIRGHELIVSNVEAEGINRVRINNVSVGLPDVKQCSLTETIGRSRTKRKGYLLGIPHKLYQYLVRKHRPVHVRFLKVIFQLGLIVMLILITQSATSHFVSGASSNMSELMHVIFLFIVSALPRVLQLGISSQSRLVKKEMLHRKLEHSIEKFWIYKVNEDSSMS